MCRGQGLSVTKEGDVRPALDETKIKTLKGIYSSKIKKAVDLQFFVFVTLEKNEYIWPSI